MYGRCLQRGRANVTDADAFIRNNIHSFDAYIYGIQQDIPLLIADDRIPMTVVINISQSVWSFIHHTIRQTLAMSNLSLIIYSYIKRNINLGFHSSVRYRLDKYIKANDIQMHIRDQIAIVFMSMLSLPNLILGIIDGVYDQNSPAYNTRGFRLGVIRLRLISEIENLRISDIENQRLQNIMYARII